MRFFILFSLWWACGLFQPSLQAALISHYDFSDGLLLDDETGDYPLTLVQNGTHAVLLHPDGYAMFPGTETGEEVYLDVAGPGNADFFTLSFWFRTDDLTQGLFQGLFANNNSSAAFSFQIHLHDGQFGVLTETGIDLQYPVTNMLTDTWYHVVLRKDSNATNITEMYLTALGETNALLIGEDPLNPGGFQRFRLGVNRGNNKLLRMDLAKVKIYNDATVDVNALLQEGPLTVPAPVFTADDYYVEAGTDVTVRWVASNATSLGIDPLDPAEAFRVDIEQDAANQLVLRWPSQPGLAFDLQSGDLPGSWTNLMSNLPAHAASNHTEVIAGPSDPLFKVFRVELK